MTEPIETNSPDTTGPETAMPTAPKRNPFSGLLTIVVVFALGGFVLMRSGILGGVAETPDFMPVSTDLSVVDLKSARPVVVVVTADWCPPCQNLKRTSLADESVRALLTDRAQSVMLDATNTGSVSQTLGQLGVRLLPTTVVLRDGRPVARLEGYANPGAYLAWLESKL